MPLSNQKRIQRKNRVRLKLKDNPQRFRLHVFRSSRSLYAQIIDDEAGKTLVAVSEAELKDVKGATKTQKAVALGELIAEKSKKKNISQVKFDRGSYQYHGRVKALAEAARAKGLNF